MEPTNRGDRMPPQVDPLGSIDAWLARFAVWSGRVGEIRIASAVLAVSFALAAALILIWGKGQTFINDEWNYLVVFRGWNLETMLHPQNGHLVAFPLILYKTLFGTVGAASHLPYQIASVTLHLLVATLFFLLARTRVPVWAAVALTVLIAFYGAGWDTVMGAYEIPNLMGMAAGLGMLLALERRTRNGDLLACLLLAVSLGSFSVGIAFALGALLAILLEGRTQWRRAWVVVVPAVLYAAWFLWARKFGQGEVTPTSISSVFSGCADQLAAICSGITGLFRIPGSIGLPQALTHRSEWGYPLALVLVSLVALHVRRAPRSVHFWTLIGVLVVYLCLVAVGLDKARTAEASRYVYMGSILVLLVVVELARDVKWSTPTRLVAVAVLCLSLLANAAALRAGGKLFQAEGETNRATLAALELERGRVDDGRSVEHVESTTHSHADMLFPIWAYYELADDNGSPAYSVDELQGADPQAREAADQALVGALVIEAVPVARPRVDRLATFPAPIGEEDGQVRAQGHCLALIPERGRTAAFKLELPPGGFGYRTAADNAVEVKLGRFSDSPATELPSVTGSAEVAVPEDDVDVPWQAEIHTSARVLACAR